MNPLLWGGGGGGGGGAGGRAALVRSVVRGAYQESRFGISATPSVGNSP